MASRHQEHGDEFWKSVSGSDEIEPVLKEQKEAFNPNKDLMVKHGGGSVMVCDCLVASSTGHLILVFEITKKRILSIFMEINSTRKSAPSLALQGLGLDHQWV